MYFGKNCQNRHNIVQLSWEPSHNKIACIIAHQLASWECAQTGIIGSKFYQSKQNYSQFHIISKHQQNLPAKNLKYSSHISDSDDSLLSTIASVLAIKLLTPNHPSLLPGINKKAVQHNGRIL